LSTLFKNFFAKIFTFSGFGCIIRERKGGEKRMSNLGNKEVLAKNLKYYVERSGKTQKELCEIVGVSTSTFNDWMKAKKYPRIDKIEIMANYFRILKSDLIEEKTEEHRQIQKKNDVLSDIIIEMRTNEDFMSIVEAVYNMDKEKRSSLLAFLK
jgi:transcriptional regulator with XRE-family HTH domain